MKTLNDRYKYGLDLYLLSIDEGITGYRDDSLEVCILYVVLDDINITRKQTVKRNQQQYDLPLKILTYEELYGWTMDAIVSEIGKKNNCTFCGVFRRQALDRGASSLSVDHIVTGHNADDIAETVLMNGVYHLFWSFHDLMRATVMRGDIARLGRCTLICTQGEDSIKRSKPFKYAYEKEIVMFVIYYLSYTVVSFPERYAYFKKLDYFSTECIYSPDAYRGHCPNIPQGLGGCSP
ncbi:putative cytoplasmic tRNA 2-thiolation protein 1 [Lanmaoa asiatica]|nr:putative cytoplasmic tRNA 2-thiolation protein 1 [Lanmaoa asiatica]